MEAQSDSLTQQRENAQEELKQLRAIALSAEMDTAYGADRRNDFVRSATGPLRPYKVGLGVYGAYEPSIYTDRVWITFSCYSETGRSYPGRFSLVWVNLRLYNNGRLVLDTANNPRGRINDPSVCDINEGVDSSFFAVSKTIAYDNWMIYITEAEKAGHGIETGPVRHIRSDTSSCSRWKTPCLPAHVREHGRPHLFR